MLDTSPLELFGDPALPLIRLSGLHPLTQIATTFLAPLAPVR